MTQFRDIARRKRRLYNNRRVYKLEYLCRRNAKRSVKQYAYAHTAIDSYKYRRSPMCNLRYRNYACNFDDLLRMNDNGEDYDRNMWDRFRIRETTKMFNKEEIINKFINKIEGPLIDYTVQKIKNHFGVTLELYYEEKQYMKFLSWLRKYDKNFKAHIVPVSKGKKNVYRLGDVDFIVKVGNNTFARFMTGTAIKKSLPEADLFNGRHIGQNDLNVYVFGKEAYKVAKIIKDFQKDDEIHCYKISAKRDENSNPEVFYDALIGRDKDTVFLNNNIKKQITDHIDKFFSNKDVYDKRNLNYKTGILFYGEPGTGKSTLANMIATMYNCDMVLINMSEFSKLNIEFLTTTINADDKTYVVVLEDIDCVIGDRESEDEDLENKKNVNKLLQFLDSTSSPSNVIFVATTNHIEKLDSAILRDGRFDLIINITDIDEHSAIDMCKSFGLSGTDIADLLVDNMSEDKRINPAKLQNLILQKMEPTSN